MFTMEITDFDIPSRLWKLWISSKALSAYNCLLRGNIPPKVKLQGKSMDLKMELWEMDGLPVAGSLWCDQTLRVWVMFSLHLLKLHRTWLCLGLVCAYLLLLLCASYCRHVFLKLWVAPLFLVGLNMTSIAVFSRTSVSGRDYKFNHWVSGWKGHRK